MGALRGETGAQDTAAEPAEGHAAGRERDAQDAAAEPADGGAEGETPRRTALLSLQMGALRERRVRRTPLPSLQMGALRGRRVRRTPLPKAADGGAEGKTGAQDSAAEAQMGVLGARGGDGCAGRRYRACRWGR